MLQTQNQLAISAKIKTNAMPAEMLNRLESSIPKIEASVAYQRNVTAMKAEPSSPRHLLKSEMRAMKFIWNLPIIKVDYLYKDERRCGLCYKKYDPEFKVCGRGESPCSLPCGHIAGHHCIRGHLSPYEKGFTRCPFCMVDFPQLFTDPVQPAQTTSDFAWENIHDREVSEIELNSEIAQLSRDTGASSDEIKRFLSIDEVIKRSQPQSEIPNVSKTGTEAQDFATQDKCLAGIGEGEFPKNRRNGASPKLARAAMKAMDLIGKKFYSEA
ncbi:hypothetical protein BDR22DRAFT_112758 [Usnea florida]